MDRIERHTEGLRLAVAQYLELGMFVTDDRGSRDEDGRGPWRYHNPPPHLDDPLFSRPSLRRWMRGVAKDHKVPFIRGHIYNHYKGSERATVDVPRRVGTRPILARFQLWDRPVRSHERYTAPFSVNWGAGIFTAHMDIPHWDQFKRWMQTDPALRRSLNLPTE